METLGITYNYETGKGTMCYIPSDLPAFVELAPVKVEFEITDENVLEAHEFMSHVMVKHCGKVAASMTGASEVEKQQSIS
jgi:hypothetical protein